MDIDQTTELMFEKVQGTISRHLEESPTEIEVLENSYITSEVQIQYSCIQKT